MRVKMRFKDRLLCGLDIIFNDNLTDGTKALYCPNCRGNWFDDLNVSESSHEYTAEYKCKNCGAIVHIQEKWIY